MGRQNLNPIDRAWLLVDRPRTPMQVGALAVFSSPADAPTDFLHTMVEQMRQAKTFVRPFLLRLRPRRLKSLLPQWEELPAESIDLDYHVRHSALPRPGGERELGTLVSRLHSNSMDMMRPLWECHVIEGLADNRFALYFKVHHACLDGVSGIRRLQRMLSPDPARSDCPPFWVAPSQREQAGGGARSSRSNRSGAPPGKVVADAVSCGGVRGHRAREQAARRS